MKQSMEDWKKTQKQLFNKTDEQASFCDYIYLFSQIVFKIIKAKKQVKTLNNV